MKNQKQINSPVVDYGNYIAAIDPITTNSTTGQSAVYIYKNNSGVMEQIKPTTVI